MKDRHALLGVLLLSTAGIAGCTPAADQQAQPAAEEASQAEEESAAAPAPAEAPAEASDEANTDGGGQVVADW